MGEEDTGAAAPKSSRSASTGSEELEETITAGGLEAPRPATEGVVEKPPPRALEVETATAAGSQGETPEETANVLSKIFFCYANRILWLGTKKQLQFKDLWEISKGDEAAQLHSAFTSHLESTKCSSSPYGRVWGGLYRTFGKAYAIAALIKAVWVVVQFAGPLLLEALLANMESATGTHWRTLGLAAGMLCASILEMILQNIHFHMGFRMGMHIKAVTIHLVFDKLTRLSLAAKSKMGSGAIANLQSNDTMKLWMLPPFMHSVWSSPIQIVVLMGLLIRILGVLPTLAGFAVTVGLIPLGGYVTKVMARVRSKVVKLTDQRVKAVSEVVTGIKAIKLYAWEEPYIKRLCDCRDQELRQVQKSATLEGLNFMLFSAGPILITMAAFGVYAALGKTLTASVAFPALAFFNLLRFPIILLPMQITSIINAKVSLKRIQDFIEMEECDKTEALPAAGNGELAVVVEDGTFAWSASKPVLDSMNLKVKAGELVVVVGEVGSGKSTLLQAILGEAIQCGGGVKVCGSVAYTSQDPWIQNMTLRDNILFGRPFDSVLYEKTIAACSLEQDLQILPAGDETEIGEKGINLSGGQKHRVALARAVYSQADVYLLDDPLSAVDAHVGSHLFGSCICDMLSGTTRILVTHQLQFLPMADRVLVIGNGRIVHSGSYSDLADQGVNFQQFAWSAEPDSKQAEEDPKVEDSTVAGSGKEANASSAKPALAQSCSVGMSLQKKPSLRRLGSLVSDEKRSKGSVKLQVYSQYFSSWGPLFILPVLALLAAGTERGLQQVQNWWLSVWAVDGWRLDGDAASNDMHYLGVFVAIGVASLVFAFVRILLMVRGAVSASRSMHRKLLDKVLRLRMSFYDTQPSGRIINRFTKDVEAMDVQLSASIGAFLVCAASTVASLAIICTAAPWFIIAVVPLAMCYGFIQNVFLKGSRELKRMDSISFSPIFSHFSGVLAGLVTVRAFRQTPAFALQNVALLNQSNRCWWPLQVANRWLATRLETLGVLLTFITAVLTAVLVPVNAGLAGLALTSAMMLTGVMNFLVRQTSELEINMNAVERILEYQDEDEEADAVIQSNRPPESWPSRGIIEVSGLVVRYREDLDPVLKGITFSTTANEKIGIVGRTGCGKSTLMMTLYRIIEPARGSIVIDGVDALAIGLRDLRTKLALVPQDPVVFSGTIRSNLDPFSQHTDSILWAALEKVSMTGFIEQMEMGEGLDSVISEGGNNVSVGQRQLLGLARALLRNSRILVLDEATSNIDNATDELIQSTIRTSFAECTVLTIAHRLHTIMHADRIMVLDNGNLMEFDAPSRLLQNKDGMFYGLVEEASRKVAGRTKSQAQVGDGIE